MLADDEPDEPEQPECSGEESVDSLLREAAEALDPSRVEPPVRRNDPATMPSESGAPRLAAGTLIAGRYRLDRRLGEGGMGEVWAATHAITRRHVALKFLKGSAARRPEMHQRFLREARAVSLVRHPGVVEVLDAFQLDAGSPVIVMDLLVGQTLGAKLARDGALPADQVAALVLPAVEAVQAAHARGIVHRDLKPENIFLETGEGGQTVVKVLDFGIAKLTATEGDAAETGALTGTGAVLGTPWYMAPEQLSGDPGIDARADVWALGVILYECLSGARPLDGSNVAQIVTRMLRDGIVPIERRVSDLDPGLARVVGRMLARERETRPRDLHEVRHVLARLAAGGDSDIGGPAMPGWPHRSRSSGVARWARAPMALVAVVGLGFFAWSRGRPSTRGGTETGGGPSGVVPAGLIAPSLSDAPSTRDPAPDFTAALAPLPTQGALAPRFAERSSLGASPEPRRPGPAAGASMNDASNERLLPGIADARPTAAKIAPPLVSASTLAPAPSPTQRDGGGIFERVPF